LGSGFTVIEPPELVTEIQKIGSGIASRHATPVGLASEASA